MDTRRSVRDLAPRGRRLLALSALVFAAYAVVGAATLALGQYAGLASPVWPAAGLAFAVVYEWGWRLTPAIALGSLASNAVTLARQDSLSLDALVVTVAIALGAALQAYVSAALVTQAVGRRASLTRAKEIIAFLLLAGPLGSMVNATVATVAQVASGLVSADQALLIWVTWWSGDAIGVVVFAPLVLMLLPGQREVWQGRRIKVLLPALLGIGLFVGFFAQSEYQAVHAREQRLQQLADEAAGELERNMARHQEVLEGLGSFFESSQEVTDEEFATFTERALRRFPNLQALSWDPIVKDEDLAQFEETQRERPGMETFSVKERNTDGELVPVQSRDDHVVVTLIEPMASNRAALGFDISSNPTRQQAIMRARETGLPSATAPIDLVQEYGTQKGMLALVPVTDPDAAASGAASGLDGVKGFAVGVYRLGDLLTDTYTDPTWASIDILLVDVTDSAVGGEIAERPAPNAPSVDLTTSELPVAYSQQFAVYGRTWQVEVIPTSGPLVNADSFRVPSTDVIGLLILTLLQAFVLVVTGMERQALRQAEHSNREAHTDELTGLENRRAFVRQLQLVRERSAAEGSSDVLLFIDLDHFKAVNDEGGHEAGDLMLQAVARVLAASVRSRDTVARIGGDEFAIILNNCPLELGHQIAEALADDVCEIEVEGPEGPLRVGISIGVVDITTGAEKDIDDLMRTADDACYVAKSAGGGVRLGSVQPGQ